MIIRLLLCLVVAVGLTGWRISGFHLPRIDDTSVPSAAVPVTKNEPAGPATPPPLAHFDPVVTRPLFRNNRTAPIVETPVAQPVRQVPEPRAKWRLVGLSARDEERIALILPPDETEPVRAREGDRIGTWTVVIIQDGFVRLSGSARDDDLWLYIE